MKRSPERARKLVVTRYPLAMQMLADGTASDQTVRALRLYHQGLGIVEIAKRMGVSRSRAHDYLKDPDRRKELTRKAKVSRACIDCGRVRSNAGSEVSERCDPCLRAKVHTEAVASAIASIQDWNARYGSPPSAVDWQGPAAWRFLHPARRALNESRHRDREWPAANTMALLFGSWNAAIKAAGFEPLGSGHKRNPESWKRHRWPQKYDVAA